jgi:hypothetical protein
MSRWHQCALSSVLSRRQFWTARDAGTAEASASSWRAPHATAAAGIYPGAGGFFVLNLTCRRTTVPQAPRPRQIKPTFVSVSEFQKHHTHKNLTPALFWLLTLPPTTGSPICFCRRPGPLPWQPWPLDPRKQEATAVRRRHPTPTAAAPAPGSGCPPGVPWGTCGFGLCVIASALLSQRPGRPCRRA